MGAHRVSRARAAFAARRTMISLRAARDEHVAVAVQSSPGRVRNQPSSVKHAAVASGVVVVALENAGAFRGLALVADLEGHGCPMRTHGASLEPAGRVDGDQARPTPVGP